MSREVRSVLRNRCTVVATGTVRDPGAPTELAVRRKERNT